MARFDKVFLGAIGTIFVLFAIGLYLMVTETNRVYREAPCSQFRNNPAQYVPLRCFQDLK